jgi:putative mRNA 3-end processing factor
MRPEDILVPSPSGVCCKLGGFHIDPTRPVERAVITHAHSDYARAGHGAVLATQETLDLMRLRCGENIAGTTQAMVYGESVNLDGAKITLHPAGHVLGSAQVAVEANGLRVVASGDYKKVADPTCAPFELVRCDLFITEATFTAQGRARSLQGHRHPCRQERRQRLWPGAPKYRRASGRRTGEEISKSFPDLLDALRLPRE